MDETGIVSVEQQRPARRTGLTPAALAVQHQRRCSACAGLGGRVNQRPQGATQRTAGALQGTGAGYRAQLERHLGASSSAAKMDQRGCSECERLCGASARQKSRCGLNGKGERWQAPSSEARAVRARARATFAVNTGGPSCGPVMTELVGRKSGGQTEGQGY